MKREELIVNLVKRHMKKCCTCVYIVYTMVTGNGYSDQLSICNLTTRKKKE